MFKLNEDGTGYRLLYSFSGMGGEGQNPYTGLVEGRDQALYGTTAYSSGGFSGGTVFRLGASSACSFDTPTAVTSCSGGTGDHFGREYDDQRSLPAIIYPDMAGYRSLR